MGKVALILFFLISCVSLKAQQSDVFVSYSEDFNKFFNAALVSDNDSLKIVNVEKAALVLEQALKEKEAFEYKFEDLKNVSVLFSPDNKIKVMTFGIAMISGGFKYYGFVMYYRGKTVTVTRLSEGNKDRKNIEKADMQADNWYGAVYYDICQFGDAKHTVYALCGWDGADIFINRKVLEQVEIGVYGELRFGGKFKTETSQDDSRVIFSYTEKAAMSLKFDKKLGIIIADHLNALPQYRGNPRFYGPDMTFDGYYYSDGVWHYEADIDVKMKRQDQKTKKTQEGVKRNPWDL